MFLIVAHCLTSNHYLLKIHNSLPLLDVAEDFTRTFVANTFFEFWRTEKLNSKDEGQTWQVKVHISWNYLIPWGLTNILVIKLTPSNRFICSGKCLFELSLETILHKFSPHYLIIWQFLKMFIDDKEQKYMLTITYLI